ncbi:MAG: asparaginase domain-containing protein [Patescibacteria group bacterium]
MTAIPIVHILSTGGTFEKVYGSGKGVRDFSFPKTSAAQEIITRCSIPFVTISYDHQDAMDSLDMMDHHRKGIVRWCQKQDTDRSVIIHGTDTMIKTGKYLATHGLGKRHTVVLTGALQPACVKGSDADLNLGSAIMVARIGPYGIFIVMNGMIFPWNLCKKNPKTGNFEAL